MSSRLAVALTAAICSSACAGLGPAVHHPSNVRAWEGYWRAQHDEQLATPRIEPVRAGDGNGRVVLLVPGLAIGEEFFEPMRARLERDGFRPVLYEDPDLLATGLVRAAKRLAARVDELTAETGQPRIDIVAECTGGVVARTYVSLFGGEQHVDHLVTFVSPHHGSMPAAMAAAVTGWQGMRDLRRESPLLSVLDRHPVAKSVRFTSIYSCSDGYLWPRDTARVDGAENVELCEGGVGHFDGFFDPRVYQTILTGLQTSPTSGVLAVH